jgi:hypothetical protein
VESLFILLMRCHSGAMQWRWYSVLLIILCVCSAQPSSDGRDEIDLTLDNVTDCDWDLNSFPDHLLPEAESDGGDRFHFPTQNASAASSTVRW